MSKTRRALVEEMWAEAEAELTYIEKLRKGELSEAEEAEHRARTLERIETGIARQRVRWSNSGRK